MSKGHQPSTYFNMKNNGRFGILVEFPLQQLQFNEDWPRYGGLKIGGHTRFGPKFGEGAVSPKPLVRLI
jgi:hypothetical protein